MPLLLPQIKTAMGRLPRNHLDYVKGLKANKLETRASPGVRTLTFRSNMEGEEDGPYLTTIQFAQIPREDFSEEPKSGFIKAKITGTDEVIYVKQPKMSQIPVSLKCSCDDFRFVWEFPLSKKKALIGAFRRYVRKTPPPPVGRPFRNPSDHVGFCKHVWNLVGVLKTKKLIKE